MNKLTLNNMGILNKITGKEDKKNKENVLDLVKETTAVPARAAKSDTGHAHRILHRHHLSEKTNQLSSIGRYVFKVATTANKIEVRKAIETVYDVHVTKVNIINVTGKNRRQGRTVGRTQDWKKAVVTLKAGEQIAGLAEGV